MPISLSRSMQVFYNVTAVSLGR